MISLITLFIAAKIAIIEDVIFIGGIVKNGSLTVTVKCERGTATDRGNMQTITINTPYITLGQFLKDVGVIDSGGAAKWYLAENSVTINDEEDNRRGRKLVAFDTVILSDGSQFTLAQA